MLTHARSTAVRYLAVAAILVALAPQHEGIVLESLAQNLPSGGGVALVDPPSRSDIKGLAYLWNNRYDGGGVSTVQSKSTNGYWPYADSDSTATRAGLCGTEADVELTFDTPEPVAVRYSPGATMTLTFKKDASSPQGHVELRMCSVASPLRQSCLNDNLLIRASVSGDTTPYDPAYPARFFMPPGAGTHTVAYSLPTDLVCANCVLQWHFIAADVCNPPGYAGYASYPPSYAFNVNLPTCGQTYPKEFWGCSDVSVLPPAQPTASAARACNSFGDAQCRVSIGYFQSWHEYRPSPYEYPASRMNARYFTHVAYAVAFVSEQSTVAPAAASDTIPQTGGYALFNRYARESNPGVKTLLSLGGFNFNSDPDTQDRFSSMVSTQQNRARFINSLIPYLRQHNFDGVDVDWEYPGHAAQGGVPADKANFALFLEELKTAIEEDTTSGARLILTVAVPASKTIANNGYDAAAIGVYADYVNLLAYDYHGPWDLTTGMHTALFSEDGANTMDAVAYWLNAGVPRSKLVVGMAAFARGWSLLEPNDNGIGAATSGPSRIAPYSREGGLASFFELSQYVRNGGYTEVVDNKTATVYAYNNVNWFSYDTAETLEIKVDFVVEMNLAGVCVWSLDQDDIRRGYPLAATLYQGLAIPQPPPSATSSGDEEIPLFVVIIIATCSAIALIILIIYCLSRSKPSDHHNAGKFEFKDNGAGVEYDTPVPIIRRTEVTHDEFVVGHDDRMQGRVMDDEEHEELKMTQLQRRLEHLSRSSNTDFDLEVVLDDEGRMVAREMDADEYYEDDPIALLKKKNGGRALQQEVERNSEGKYVARHYDDDLESELIQSRTRSKKHNRKNRVPQQHHSQHGRNYQRYQLEQQ